MRGVQIKPQALTAVMGVAPPGKLIDVPEDVIGEPS